MKFLLKTEASREIGFGHLKRLEVLAKELQKRGHEVNFVHFNSDVYMPNIKGEESFLKLCETNDVLIIDEPNFPKNYYSCLKIIKTIGIDELSPLRQYLDVHICSTLLGLEGKIIKNKKSIEYIGVKYFIFGRGIKYSNKNNRILVSFGGSDPRNITEKFLENFELDNLDVVIGPGFSKKRVKTLKEKYQNISFLENIKQLSQKISPYKFIACSGGVTAYEALKSKCIPLIIAQNQEQEDIAKNLFAKGLGYYFGKSNQFDKKALLSILKEGIDRKVTDSMFKNFEKLNGEDSTTLVVDLLIKHGQSKKI
ncbi:MAG: hypothetical protein COB02_13210 [Candidatus Cloacimonadota bacterium]|nr:MAG: hypothetical protein COB02_13210 [Candidatus Cloacimonadota bacterium]